MKTLINKIVFIAALAFAVNSYGQSSTNASVTGASTNNWLTNGARIHQLTIANATAATLTLTLFDAPSNSPTNTQAAYTNYLTYTTNIITTNTMFSGNLQTNTNSGIYTYSSVVAANIYTYRVLATVVVPTATTLVYSPTNGLLAAQGVCTTNNTNYTLTISYTPNF